jgi:hypothetical protein
MNPSQHLRENDMLMRLKGFTKTSQIFYLKIQHRTMHFVSASSKYTDKFWVIENNSPPRNITNKHPISIFVLVRENKLSAIFMIHQSAIK